MKKFVATILTLLLAITCLMAFVGCNDNDENGTEPKYGDNYMGTLSNLIYDSEEDAVKGFLKEEISGLAFNAEYVKYDKTEQKEIDEITIEEEYINDIESIVSVDVEYLEVINHRNNSITHEDPMNKIRTVYVVKYKNGYKYFTIPVKVGETLTKSYWEYIKASSKYQNCTITVNKFLHSTDEHRNLYVDCSMKLADNLMSVKQEGRELLDNGVYVDSKYSFSALGIGSTYIICDENGKYVACDNNDSYSVRYLTNQDFTVNFDLFLNVVMDHSICEKTAKGYKESYMFKDYVDILDHLGAEYWNHKLSLSATIVDDKVEAFEFDILLPERECEDGELKYKCKLSDFGTTVVEIPQDAIDAINDYKLNH